MRLYSYACLCALLPVGFASSARAQGRPVEAGAKIGVALNSLSNLPDAVGDRTLDTGRRTGLVVGGYAARRLTDAVWLAPEVWFVQKGMNVSGGALAIPDGAAIKLTEIEVPVLVQYRMGTGTRTPYVFAGPTFGFVTGAHVSASVFGLDPSSDDIDVNDEVRGFETGIVAGGGVLAPRWLAEARFSWGLTRINETGTADFTDDIRTNAIAFVFGVRF